MAFILTNHRGPENLCRLAVQLCVLRKHGRLLANYLQVAPAVLGYLCRQLDLTPIGPSRGKSDGIPKATINAKLRSTSGGVRLMRRPTPGCASGLSNRLSSTSMGVENHSCNISDGGYLTSL
jgi:hypothetical protein